LYHWEDSKCTCTSGTAQLNHGRGDKTARKRMEAAEKRMEVAENRKNPAKVVGKCGGRNAVNGRNEEKG
jgi:hypothetical protein